MEYVNKNQAPQANAIIDAYLSVLAIPGQYRYRELYQGFSGNFGKNNLINNVLLPEQGYRCCYCMRSIPSNLDGTIEHIIPESVSSDGMNYYFNKGLGGLIAANICHTRLYVEGNSEEGQYPHEVAYYNYAMACLKCNNERRGNKEIYPLFLVPNINRHVNYNRSTGKIVWQNDPDFLNPTIEKLELNGEQLKAIRSVWIFGHDNPTQTYSTPDTVSGISERNELIYRAFGNAFMADSRISIDAYLSLLNDEGWRLVLKYAYFATI